MGGGDLNFKKSWHPHTKANIEKVWIAEQKDLGERRKIEQLQKEQEEERIREDIRRAAEDAGHRKRVERVDWMYAGAMGADNSEAFLLGKPVDKTVLPKDKSEDVNASHVPEPVAEDATTNFRDMSQKVREDPMYMIKRKEQEQLRRLKANPTRVRELLGIKDKDKSKKKSKKSKKSKKKERSSSPDERAEPSRDHSSRDRDRDDRRGHRSPSPRRRHDDRDSYRGRSRGDSRAQLDSSSSSRRDRDHRASPDDRRAARRSPGRTRDRSRSPPRHAMRSRDRSRSPPRLTRERSRSPPRHYERRERQRSRSPPRRRRSPPRRSPSPESDAEERAKKLEQMMSNAKWRSEDREKRVMEFNEKDGDEDIHVIKQGDAQFLRDFNQHALNSKSTESLEERLRRNRHYIQRTEHAFATGGLKGR